MKHTLLFFTTIVSISSFAQSGISWNMGANVAASTSGNHHPRVTVDGSGNPLLIWGNTNRAMFSRWTGSSFSTPVMVNPMSMTIAEGTWMGPDIAAHGDTVYVVFKQTPEADTGSHIYVIRSVDGGMNFSMPVQVDKPADKITRFPTITTDASGNPLVAYMHFNSGFGNAQWVVAKSTNLGNTFSPSVQASGWSSGMSTVCDCCPGSIVCSGNTVTVLYRDNNSNIRDTWAGISTDGGTTFTSGMGIDQQNWMLMSCPGSGPDGYILGDTLYSAFMNGAGGMNSVYTNASSISGGTGSAGIAASGAVTGLSLQNFPSVAGSGTAVAMAWKQVVSGADQCVLRFTNNILNGLPMSYDTVDLNNVTNVDLAMSPGNIIAVWEDDGSGTVKYRTGTYISGVAVNEISGKNNFGIFPNPADESFVISYSSLGNSEKATVEITDISGRIVFTQYSLLNTPYYTGLLSEGVYFVTVKSADGKSQTQKLIIQR